MSAIRLLSGVNRTWRARPNSVEIDPVEALAFREGDPANEPDWLFLELSDDGSCDVANVGKYAENGTAG
jgi:hypothetical protein